MGAGISSLSGSKTMSGEDLKRNSKEITEMSNALFQFMYTNWQPKDVWEIANDPSKYVIAISDMITTQFHVLGYKTKSGRIGEIYFQKWDALEPPMDKDQITNANSRNSRNEKNSRNVEKKRATRRLRSDAGYGTQKQNAEIIAFYFIRIFQILGAMLLVVKDINMPEYDKKTGEKADTAYVNASRNFAQQSHQVISGFKPPTYKGGARISVNPGVPLGPYDFLRYYLRQISNEDLERFAAKSITLDAKKEYMFDGSDTMIFEFTPYVNVSDIRAENRVQQRIGFIVKTTGGYEKVYIGISVKEITFDLNGEVSSLQGYKAPSEREEKTRLSAYPTRVKLEYDVPGKKSRVVFTRVSQAQSSINLGVEYQLSSDEIGLIDFLKTQGLSPRKNFIQMLENISMYYIKQNNPAVETVKFDTKKKVEENDGKGSKVKAPKNKSLEGTFTTLTDKEYQPHCIARALQLLDSASINNFPTGSAVSNVCKYAIGNKSSMKLSEYVPTRSVGQLFGKINPLDHKSSLDVLKAFAQKGATGDPLNSDQVKNIPSESMELEAAIKRISTAFGIPYVDQKGLSSIELQISSKCDPVKEKGKEILIDRASQKFRDMKSASQQLLAYHLKQIIEISKFLKKIFNISQRPDGSWKVEGPKTELLFAGFETMNTLTDQARTLLIDYYSGCEEIYQKGLKTWEEGQSVAADKNAPVLGQVISASAPPASAPPAPGVLAPSAPGVLAPPAAL
uniref:Uncharacterized protein n=1 Tax=viral metagenome TaxID=1070528 RepID=A0A6C0DJL8_9ZZZZ